MKFFGNSLPERLRSTTLALTGVVAACCLALVGLILQQGLPVADSGPIHGPIESEIGQARALVEREPEPQEQGRAASVSVAEKPATVAAPVSTETPSPAAAPPPPTRVAEPALRDGREGPGRPSLEARPEKTAAPAPAPAPVEEPVATPSRELPEPAPEESAEEPTTVPGNGNAYGRGGGTGPEGAGPPGLSKK